MADTTAPAKADTAAAKGSSNPADDVAPKAGYWKVRVSHPQSNKRTVFRTMSESRARTWLINRSPRGEEFYLESPDGTTESYVDVRHNTDGSDAPQWTPFDPQDYVPPGEAVPPGDAGWPDIEG